MNFDHILSYVRETVGEGKRLDHILRTKEECARLASLFSLSDEQTDDLLLSALLHDLTKQWTVEEHKVIFEKYHLPFEEAEIRSPKTLHSKTGAYLARDRFPNEVNDTVFNAILTHTVGCADMTIEQKLLYLADYIEYGRTHASCVELRNAFYDIPKDIPLLQHLDNILLKSFDMTLIELVEAGAYIHPTTIEARNFLL